MTGKDGFDSITSLDALRTARKDNCREMKVLRERMAADVEEVKDCLKLQNVVDGLFASFAPLLKLYRLFFR